MMSWNDSRACAPTLQERRRRIVEWRRRLADEGMPGADTMETARARTDAKASLEVEIARWLGDADIHHEEEAIRVRV